MEKLCWNLGILLGVMLCTQAHAQLKSLSPDLVVDCSVSPCTIRSVAPIVKNAAQSMSIDQTYVGQTLLRNGSVAMSDTLGDPGIIGNGNVLSVCTTATTDLISAASPVINGRTSITLAPWQCVDFQSDGSNFLAILSWQASARQRCPDGQQMVSGSPFSCTAAQ